VLNSVCTQLKEVWDVLVLHSSSVFQLKKKWQNYITRCWEGHLSCDGAALRLFLAHLLIRVSYVGFASFSCSPLTIYLWNREQMKCSSNNEAISWATYQALLPLLHPSRTITTQAVQELFVAAEEDTVFDPHKRRTNILGWVFFYNGVIYHYDTYSLT